LQRMADARADLQALAKHLVALCQFTTSQRTRYRSCLGPEL
jgi:hypothetical protein